MGRAHWVTPGASTAMRCLAMNDRSGSPRHPCCSLPACIYSDCIAPFLCFNGPLPGQLYAIGGRDQMQDPLDVVEMFDTWHGQWVACPNMLERRAGCSAALLPDGRLLVAGGYDKRGIVEGLLSTCEVFDPALQRWSIDAAELSYPRWGHGCAPLRGFIFTVGGCSLQPGAPAREAFMETLRSCEVYDPSSNKWRPGPDLNVARAGARVVALSDRFMAVVGGCDDVFGQAELLPTVELFDADVGKWSILDMQLSTPRTTAAAAAMSDHQILIVGGAPSLSSAEVYHLPALAERQGTEVCEEDPCTRRAEAPAVHAMTEGRMGCQAVALNLPSPDKAFPICSRSCIVVVGGENGDDDVESNMRQFNSVLVYDIEGQSWRAEQSFPPIPTPRTATALVVGPGLVSGYP
mmetsp:Transcript_117950/g.234973  ORF Transcript_117950/g.234973 Transcript_117950/m.234973 type:complete len:406 (-) Transcript_117950:474-1691(-)